MSDWMYDSTSNEWVHAKTGVRYTDQVVRTMSPVAQTRITGTNPLVTQSVFRDDDPDDGPLKAALYVDDLDPGTAIRFVTHNRFTYLALYMPGPNPDGEWYITGNGKWFGQNTLTNEQMSEVLARDTTSEIRMLLVSDEDAHARLT